MSDLSATMEQDSPRREFGIRRSAAVSLLLLILGVLVYLPILGTGLLSDDWGLSLEPGSAGYSKEVWASWHGHWFGGGHGDFYRPLARTAIYYQARVFGYDGLGQHLVSVLLFAGTGIMLFLALNRAGHGLAGIAAGLIAVTHPAAVESVSWISSQTDCLVLIWFVACLLVSIGPLSPARIALSAVCAFLCYASKETSLLLGPTVAGAVAYTVLFVKPLPESRQRLLVLGGVHLGMWICYLGARKVFLGRILPDLPSAPLQQMGANVYALLHELFSPLLSLFPDRRFLEAETSFNLAALLLIPGLAIAAAIWRRHLLAVICGWFLLASLPFIQTLGTSFSTEGNERYLYHPLWFFSAMMGLLLEPGIHWLLERRAQFGLILVGALYVMHASFETQRTEQPYLVAADLRRQIETQLDGAGFDKAINPVLVMESVPDRVHGAYVFRNGFPEFIHARYGRAVPQIKVTDAKSRLYPHEVLAYRVLYLPETYQCIASADQKLSEFLGPRAPSGDVAPAAPPMVLDFSNPQLRTMKMLTSGDLQPTAPVNEQSLAFRIVGPDPNIGVPLPRNFHPSMYRKATIVYQFLDGPVGTPIQTEAIFHATGEAKSPITRTLEFTPTGDIQTVEFSLGDDFSWSQAEGLRWFRFDPCGPWPGTLLIYRMGFE